MSAVGTQFASCQMTAVWLVKHVDRCMVPPPPPQILPLHSFATVSRHPWEEVCCASATLNQQRPNEVSHLTPSSLGLSQGVRATMQRPSISSIAWLTHFDSWEILAPVRTKIASHQNATIKDIHQGYLLHLLQSPSSPPLKKNKTQR